MRIIIRTFFLTNKDNTVMQLTFSYKMTQINEVLILNRDFSLDLPICVAFLSDMLKQMLVLTRALGLHQCNIGVVYMCKQHENHLDILLSLTKKKLLTILENGKSFGPNTLKMFSILSTRVRYTFDGRVPYLWQRFHDLGSNRVKAIYQTISVI